MHRRALQDVETVVSDAARVQNAERESDEPIHPDSIRADERATGALYFLMKHATMTF
jgi:hypothetical protein